MKHSTVYKFLNTNRFFVISFSVILIAFITIKGNAYTFDCEPPSKESFSVEKNEQDERNRESLDKCMRGEGDERDRERADSYLKENMAKSP